MQDVNTDVIEEICGFAWGCEYDKTDLSIKVADIDARIDNPGEPLRRAIDPVCPYCGQFSFFCRGDFFRNKETGNYAATDWRANVIGFVSYGKVRGICTDIVGTATMLCIKCKRLFAFTLRASFVESYFWDCEPWKEAVRFRRKNAAAIAEKSIELLRKSARLPATMTPIEVVAELDRREVDERKAQRQSPSVQTDFTPKTSSKRRKKR